MEPLRQYGKKCVVLLLLPYYYSCSSLQAMVEAKLEEIAKEVPHVELPPSEPWFDSADLRIPKAAAGPLEGTSELLGMLPA